MAEFPLAELAARNQSKSSCVSLGGTTFLGPDIDCYRLVPTKCKEIQGLENFCLTVARDYATLKYQLCFADKNGREIGRGRDQAE